MHTQAKVWQMPSHQRLNVGHPDGFANWLAGLVDGDGCFHFRQNKNGSWDFSFKISQSNYNQKLLAYLKKKLQCGSVTKAGHNCSQFRVRNIKILWEFLIPLFETTEFITDQKTFDYWKFKTALNIYMQWKSNHSFSSLERDQRLYEIKSKRWTQGLIKAPWKLQKSLGVERIPSVGWILGFTEAEGSFYLTKKANTRLVHGAGWIQTNEKELLELMRQRWHIKTKVKLHVKGQAWVLDTTASKAVETLIVFFEGKLKGMKAIEVRKWARSYRKFKGHYKELEKLQNQLRKAKKLISSIFFLFFKIKR